MPVAGDNTIFSLVSTKLDVFYSIRTNFIFLVANVMYLHALSCFGMRR